MSHLLHTIEGSRIKNHTIFRHTLYLYDDKMVYRYRRWFKTHDITVSYNHVSQVHLKAGILFANLWVVNTGGVENIEIKNIRKKEAIAGKALIEKKVYGAHVGHRPNYATENQPKLTNKAKEVVTSLAASAEAAVSSVENLQMVKDVERSLSRLTELLYRKKISKKEFNKRKQDILKRLN
ncbi:MAG: hypothetical protein R3B92_00180 [Patescibacteria group bacterium]